MISKTADTETIEQHVRHALMKAIVFGGWILAMAKEFLAKPIADIDAVLAVMHPAIQADEQAWAALKLAADKCRHVVCTIKDELFGLLGRTHHNSFMAQVLPGGVDTFTVGEPVEIPVLLNVLQRRIALCTAPDVTDEHRARWIANVEVASQGLIDALEKHKPTAGPAKVEKAAYMATVQIAREQLRRFKQGLENRGQTKAQIAEIVLEVPRSGPKAPKTPAPPSDSSGTTKAG